MMLLKYIIPIFLLYSNSALSKIAGAWYAKSNNKQHGFSLEIKKIDNNIIQVGYMFTYNAGRKINEYTFDRPPLYFIQQKNGCYKGRVFGFFAEKKVGVTLCKKGNGLMWSRFDQPMVSYVPKKELFLKVGE